MAFSLSMPYCLLRSLLCTLDQRVVLKNPPWVISQYIKDPLIFSKSLDFPFIANVNSLIYSKLERPFNHWLMILVGFSNMQHLCCIFGEQITKIIFFIPLLKLRTIENIQSKLKIGTHRKIVETQNNKHKIQVSINL